MDSKLKDLVKEFLESFEQVFDKDWQYSKEMIGVQEETEEQRKSAADMGLETIEIISKNGTFLNPKVDDEMEDWGYRGELLKKYRELKKVIERE